LNHLQALKSFHPVSSHSHIPLPHLICQFHSRRCRYQQSADSVTLLSSSSLLVKIVHEDCLRTKLRYVPYVLDEEQFCFLVWKMILFCSCNYDKWIKITVYSFFLANSCIILLRQSLNKAGILIPIFCFQ